MWHGGGWSALWLAGPAEPLLCMGLRGGCAEQLLNWATSLHSLGLLAMLCHPSQALDKVCSGQILEDAKPCQNLVLEKLCRAEQRSRAVFFRSLVSELTQKQEEKTLASSVSL